MHSAALQAHATGPQRSRQGHLRVHGKLLRTPALSFVTLGCAATKRRPGASSHPNKHKQTHTHTHTNRHACIHARKHTCMHKRTRTRARMHVHVSLGSRHMPHLVGTWARPRQGCPHASHDLAQ